MGETPSFLYRLLSHGSDGRGLHGPGQAGRDKASLRPQRVGHPEEYLLDFAGPELRAAAGEARIAEELERLDTVDRRRAERMLAALRRQARCLLSIRSRATRSGWNGMRWANVKSRGTHSTASTPCARWRTSLCSTPGAPGAGGGVRHCKLACVMTNRALGVWVHDDAKAEAVERACREMAG